jgi:hypothetical protein
MSVNGRAFAKCSACSISAPRRDYGQSAVLELFVRNPAKISVKFNAKLFWVISIMEDDCHAYAKKPDQICN